LYNISNKKNGSDYMEVKEESQAVKVKKRYDQTTAATFNLYIIVISIMASMASIGMGFYKMFVYRNSDSDSEYFVSSDFNKNAYVGGDAYNYIINGTYTTAYFVLGLTFMLLACALMIIHTLKNQKEI